MALSLPPLCSTVGEFHDALMSLFSPSVIVSSSGPQPATEPVNSDVLFWEQYRDLFKFVASCFPEFSFAAKDAPSYPESVIGDLDLYSVSVCLCRSQMLVLRSKKWVVFRKFTPAESKMASFLPQKYLYFNLIESDV